MSMRTGQTGAHRSARVGRVIEPVHLSAGAIPRQTLLIVNHGVVTVSGVAPRRSLEAEMLRCRGVDLHQICSAGALVSGVKRRCAQKP